MLFRSPGPILSTAKELSTVLPKGKNGQDELSKLISKMFNGTFFADHDVSGKIIKGTEKPLDFRTELGLAIFENIPVLLNMICVRGFYFVRRFIEESRKKKNDSSYHVNWRNTLPFANPTIIRMTTVANCTFSAIDLAGAAIVSAAKSGGNIYAFLGNMLININYVGIGRTCISLGEEAFIGIKKHSLKKKKYVEIVKLANLYQAKLFVLENQTWIEIKETDLVMKQLEKVSEDASRDLIAYSINMEKNFETIENELKDNDKLREYILKKLEP